MPHNASNLDLLRSLAVFFVVLSHLPFPSLNGSDFHMQALGLFGVLMFFVHTCLVLMYSLERQNTKDNGKGLIRKFFVRRFFRIYPLSILIVCTLFLFPIFNNNFPFDRNVFLSNLLLIQNLTHQVSIPGALWSLPYEVQMYLLLPFVYLVITKYQTNAISIALTLWLVAVLFILVLYFLRFDYHLFKYIPCFLPGVFAYRLYKLNKVPLFSQQIFFLYLLLLAACYPVLVAHGYKENLIAWPFCLVIGFLIPWSRNGENQSINYLVNKVAQYSYGIYLFHGPVIFVCFELMDKFSFFLKFSIFILLTAILSYLAYHLVEKPLIKFGGNLT